MAKPTRIVVWFDDDTWYEIDPGRFASAFMSQAAANMAGHHPPYETPGPNSGIKGPFHGPVADATASSDANALEGSCYWVNGVIVCP